jgi:hypothetical protein
LNLFIATPSYNGKNDCSYTQCALATQFTLLNAGVTHLFRFEQGAGSPQISRGILTAQFMAARTTKGESFSHLMFIDSDIEWHPKAITHLLAASEIHPVCCGAYPLKKQPLGFPVNFMSDPPRVHEGTGYVQLKDAPTGFLMIRREVIERLMDANPDLKCRFRPELPEDELQYEFDLFHQHIDTDCPHRMFLSEDFGFSRLWQRIGGEVWAHPEIALAHHGHARYTGKLADVLNGGQ